MDANYRTDAGRLALFGGLLMGTQLLVFLPAAQSSGWMNFHIDDSWMYARFADQTAVDGFLRDSSSADEYVRARMPGYPILLMGIRWAAVELNVSVGAATTILNVLFLIASAMLIHLTLIRTVGDPRVAWLGAAAVFVVPGMAPYVFAHMPESMTLFLWSAAAACLTSRNRSLAPWSAGMLAGMATLTKPVSLTIAVATIPILFLMKSERRPRRAVLFTFGLIPLPALWVFRNWLLWGTVLMTPNSGTHLYDYLRGMLRQHQGLASAQRHPLTGLTFDARIPTTREGWRERFGFDFDNLGKRTQLLGRLATEEILADPVGFAKMAAVKQPRLYVGAGAQALYSMSFDDPDAARIAVRNEDWIWNSGWWAYQGASSILLALGYGLSALGAWRGLRDRRWRTTVLVCLALLLVQSAVVGPFGHTRYRFLMTPLFGVLAAIGMAGSRSRQHQVVAVDHFLPSRSGKQVRKLRGRAAHDPPRLVGRVVR